MPLVTANELATELHLSAKQIRRLALAGKIPAMRFASEWRFDLEAVRKAATYTDPIAADARQAARRAFMGPPRALGQSGRLIKTADGTGYVRRRV